MSALKSKNKIIGITLGDPCGVGPEIIAKSLSKASVRKLARFVVIGNEAVCRRYLKSTYKECSFVDPINVSADKYTAGHPNKKSAKAAFEYLRTARRILANKKIDSLVTGPVSKEGICSLGVRFKGHTEFLANYFNVKDFAMMFISKSLKTVVVTRHIPLNQVSKRINAQLVEKTISLTYKTLKRHFRVRNPKIAICGLNPHAGENGNIGKEEIKIIIPAMNKARRKGANAFGPFPADTIFCPDSTKHYDVIIAMYHDQGLIPIKTLHFNELVNFTIGLPFIRTSPAHGTAYGIAGKNIADSSPMEEAIRLAAALSR